MPPVIKSTPEDFVVEEIPAYEASGEGAHLFVTFTKRGLTTDMVVTAMARALGIKARDVGVAGLKDRIGVTTQTVSLPWRGGLDDAVRGLVIEGVTWLAARRHGNKLKTGHLRGNRFMVRVRGASAEEEGALTAALERIGREGAPNAFGEQRFGRAGDNAVTARAWLSGHTRPPRDPRQARFLVSALQSAVFNEVLARRVADGTWRTPLEGDVVRRNDSGGLFVCTDVQADRERADRGEVCPTGPLFGPKMLKPDGVPAALEDEVFREVVGPEVDLEKAAALAEGGRRPLVLNVEELRVEREEGVGVRVYFVLPKGAYATTVLAAGGVVAGVVESGARDDR